MTQKIIILDFGSQTTQLIGRRVRELDTFCEIMPYNKFPNDDPSVIGVILSGSPYSVHDPEAFKVDLSQFVGKVPVLGICYGAQFISHTLGGKVEKADSREYGRANLETVDTTNPLFKGFEQHSQVWMSHGDTITAIPESFKVIGSTKDVKNAGTMVTPFMLVVMLAGLLPMFQDSAATNLAIYLIPFYNSIEVMTAVFLHEMQWLPVVVTLVSDVVYTGIAVWGLTRMFNSEKVMFSA